MRRWITAIGLIVSLMACSRAVEAPSPRPTASPTSHPGAATLPATPRPSTRTPLPTPSPLPTIRRPTPPPFPEGFHTDPDWLQVFYPTADAKRWESGQPWTTGGAVWWTNGERWIGPFPTDEAKGPFWPSPVWTWRGGQRFFCHEPPSIEAGVSVCFPIPDALGFHPAEDLPKENVSFYGEKLVECGSDGALCLTLPDGQRSSPFRLPLPPGLQIQTAGIAAGAQVPSVQGCLSPDRRRAVLFISRLGGPFLGVGGLEEDAPLTFPGAIYWVNLETGEVRPAPTNAPDLPARRALAQAMVAQGTLPAPFLPFLDPPPTLLGQKPLRTAIDFAECSPSGRFALTYLLVLIGKNKDDYFSVYHQQWLIRIEDGSGVPVAISNYDDRLFHTTTRWIRFWDSRLKPLVYQDPKYALPWELP